MGTARIPGAIMTLGLAACVAGCIAPTTGTPHGESRAAPSTRPAALTDAATDDQPWFRAGVYSGRLVRRFIDVDTTRTPVHKLMQVGAAACDDLLRFEMKRSFTRRSDPAEWQRFREEQQLDDLETPRECEADVALLIVPRDGQLGLVIGNNPIVLYRSAEKPSEPVASAKFEGRELRGEWRLFHEGRSSGVALRFTPREDSGRFSMRTISLSDALEQDLGQDVLFCYGLSIFANRIAVELSILYWRGYAMNYTQVMPWPPAEFDAIFEEKIRRDFGGDRRAFEEYFRGMGGFLSRVE